MRSLTSFSSRLQLTVTRELETASPACDTAVDVFGQGRCLRRQEEGNRAEVRYVNDTPKARPRRSNVKRVNKRRPKGAKEKRRVRYGTAGPAIKLAKVARFKLGIDTRCPLIGAR